MKTKNAERNGGLHELKKDIKIPGYYGGKIKNHKAWTVEQTAAYLDMCLKTVYKYIKNGKLPATKVGRQYYISSYDARKLKR